MTYYYEVTREVMEKILAPLLKLNHLNVRNYENYFSIRSETRPLGQFISRDKDYTRPEARYVLEANPGTELDFVLGQYLPRKEFERRKSA